MLNFEFEGMTVGETPKAMRRVQGYLSLLADINAAPKSFSCIFCVINPLMGDERPRCVVNKKIGTQMERLTRILLTLLLLGLAPASQAGELLLTGVYHGTNLYVQNPHDGNNRYCVRKIFVNGRRHQTPPKSSVFTIDLSELEMNSPVNIEIVHSDNCEPKVINPNAIRVKDEFQFVFLDVDGENLHWQVKGERKMGQYFIEKFEHNNWDMQKAVNGKGKAGLNDYNTDVLHHAGKNRYRIKYLEVSGRAYYSSEVIHESENEPVNFYPRKVNDRLNFSREITYEIRDAYGNKVLEGKSEKVDCNNLNPGLYYVSFDNRTEKFFKK